jgi:hypothetical protein
MWWKAGFPWEEPSTLVATIFVLLESLSIYNRDHVPMASRFEGPDVVWLRNQ